jgi:hypothetical protein
LYRAILIGGAAFMLIALVVLVVVLTVGRGDNQQASASNPTLSPQAVKPTPNADGEAKAKAEGEAARLAEELKKAAEAARTAEQQRRQQEAAREGEAKAEKQRAAVAEAIKALDRIDAATRVGVNINKYQDRVSTRCPPWRRHRRPCPPGR